MPTPSDLLRDPVTITLFLLYGGMILWEALSPVRILMQVPGWRRRGLSAFLLYFLISTYLPMVWSEHLARLQWFDLTALGTGAGALVGLLIYEAGVYLWHRAMHASDLLWRCFHQWLHSAERLDTYGAFWFSPLEMIGWTVLASLALTLVVGLTPAARKPFTPPSTRRSWRQLLRSATVRSAVRHLRQPQSIRSLRRILGWSLPAVAEDALGAGSLHPSAMTRNPEEGISSDFDRVIEPTAMASDPRTCSLLRTLAATKPSGRFLELGSGTGLSTAWILDGMDGASLLAILRRHLGSDPRLEIICADGDAFLPSLKGEVFDFIRSSTTCFPRPTGRSAMAPG